MGVTAFNFTQFPVEYVFPSTQVYDFAVSDSQALLYNWAHNRCFAPVILTRTVQNSQLSFCEEEKITRNTGEPIPEGNLTLEARTTSSSVSNGAEGKIPVLVNYAW